jgi:2-amino-4-hydroxy-6-hydroxymethyldihydropteridine diphosphokinase
MPVAYLGLGSNLGDREGNLRAAREKLALLPDTVLLRNAPLYETTPVGGSPGQGMFLNSVSTVRTELPPREFLRGTQAVERELGRIREREAERWCARTSDIDILFWDDAIIMEEDLVVPHPRLAERLFVLLPLADVAEDFVHPVLGATVGELLSRARGAERNAEGNNEGIRRLSV